MSIHPSRIENVLLIMLIDPPKSDLPGVWKVKTAIDEVAVLHRKTYPRCYNSTSIINTKYRMSKSVAYSVCLTVNDKS